MDYKSNTVKVVPLLLGSILLLFIGFSEEKNCTMEEEQMIEENKLSDEDTVESAAAEVPEFPEDMLIPDSANAELPELTHFLVGKYYFRKLNKYSDTELKLKLLPALSGNSL